MVNKIILASKSGVRKKILEDNKKLHAGLSHQMWMKII